MEDLLRSARAAAPQKLRHAGEIATVGAGGHRADERVLGGVQRVRFERPVVVHLVRAEQASEHGKNPPRTMPALREGSIVAASRAVLVRGTAWTPCARPRPRLAAQSLA